MRALPSMPPPGAKGTMSVMGRVGQACAAASPLHAIAAANARDSNFICLERALPLGILVQYQRPHIEGFVRRLLARSARVASMAIQYVVSPLFLVFDILSYDISSEWVHVQYAERSQFTEVYGFSGSQGMVN